MFTILHSVPLDALHEGQIVTGTQPRNRFYVPSKILWFYFYSIAPFLLSRSFLKHWNQGEYCHLNIKNLWLHNLSTMLSPGRIYMLGWESLSGLFVVLMEVQIVKLDSDIKFVVCINKRKADSSVDLETACSRQWAY